MIRKNRSKFADNIDLVVTCYPVDNYNEFHFDAAARESQLLKETGSSPGLRNVQTARELLTIPTTGLTPVPRDNAFDDKGEYCSKSFKR